MYVDGPALYVVNTLLFIIYTVCMVVAFLLFDRVVNHRMSAWLVRRIMDDDW